VQATAELERYLTAAHVAGCPADQAERFVRGQYVALPWALPFHAAARDADSETGPFWIALGGARGPGKSHAVLAQAGLDDCQRVPGLKFLYLRKIQKSASESLDDLARAVFHAIGYDYNTSTGRIVFPNGSRIIVGGFKDATDIDKYIGIQYDGLIVEEVTQIAERKLTELRGSVRSSKPGWRERAYISTNPGGVGHKYFKDNFVSPLRRGEIGGHAFMGGAVRYYPSTYRDNPFLSAGYIAYLESLTGPLGAAWRDGDFDAFEGMAFPDWDDDSHVIVPFAVPAHWPRWRAIDWGYAAPFVCLWLTRDVDSGRIYVYNEYSATRLTDRQQARMVVEYTSRGDKIAATYADPSMWAKKSMDDQVTTTADEYKVEGVELTKADNDRLQGVRKLHRVLGSLPDGKPGLQIFNACRYLIETLANLPSDPNNPEDVDTKADDHAYDALRYALTNYEAQRGIDPEQQKQKQERARQIGRAREKFAW
jgi:phage terminase large subunit